MAAKLIIASEAERDIAEGCGCDESQRTRFGEAFLICIDAYIQAVCRIPEMRATIHENCRRGLVRSFPHSDRRK